jgi:hypothetical protein
MSRLVVEVVRADEVCEGDEVVIVEFRDRVVVARPHTNDARRTWIELESDEGAELTNDSQVLRVLGAA